MKNMIPCCAAVAVLLFACCLSFSQGNIPAQPKVIECSTQGTSTQSDKLQSITIRINGYSTDEERTSLIKAYDEKGSEGLYSALKKMPSKGRVSLSGTNGFDLKFVRLLPESSKGILKIRLVTDRPIAAAEHLKASTRTMDYNLAAIEVNLDSANVQDKSTGILLPACEFVIDKTTRELNIKTYQNPWKLFNFFGVK